MDQVRYVRARSVWERMPAALCESLLHDVPLTGGRLVPEHYERSVAGALETTRPLRLATFHGLGLRRLGVESVQLTASPARTYGATVACAQAAHAAGLDRAVWMSARLNTDHANVFFGDRVREQDLRVVTSYGRVFTTGPDRDWLVDSPVATRSRRRTGSGPRASARLRGSPTPAGSGSA